MRKAKIYVIALIALSAVTSVNAQFSVNVDLVSNYVFRGVQQDPVHTNGTPNIQPTISFAKGGFTIGTWGSYSIAGTTKEVDLFATYTFSKIFSVTLTDYNFRFTKSYFDYGKTTDHILEGTVNYAGVASFPLSISANTMFFGADKKEDGNQAFSTYVELAYPVTSYAKIFLGSSLTESPNYVTKGFGITNVGIKVSKAVEITDKFSLPVFGILGWNPNAKDAFLVAGISL